nr:uncharacterized protein LOC115264388 [Aedes albopictus]
MKSSLGRNNAGSTAWGEGAQERRHIVGQCICAGPEAFRRKAFVYTFISSFASRDGSSIAQLQRWTIREDQVVSKPVDPKRSNYGVFASGDGLTSEIAEETAREFQITDSTSRPSGRDENSHYGCGFDRFRSTGTRSEDKQRRPAANRVAPTDTIHGVARVR